MAWQVSATKAVAKQLRKLPGKIGLIYIQFVEDLENEGPKPSGWDVKPLKGSRAYRIRLTREYRVVIEVVAPQIIVVTVAHRKDVYR